MTLAEAARLLIDQQQPVHLVLVGQGKLEEKIKTMLGEHVTFAGALPHESLPPIYASADLFVFPSLSETFGNVLTESLASGLVSVSYDYAAARQHVLHGRNGFVAEPEEERAFLESIDAALDHWKDPVLRENARQTAGKLSWDTIVEQFESELSGVNETLSPILSLNTPS